LLLADAGPVSASPARPPRRAPRGQARSAPAQRPQPPHGNLPVSALLSQALVAFTIEFDNEAERRLPHRTTSHGTSGDGDATWLVPLAMWENCMRYVTGDPLTAGDLEARARTRTNLDGMRRWGYITIDGTAKKVHNGRPGPDAVLRATVAGLRAREIWRPLAGLVEQRWQERFGADRVAALRDPLTSMVSRLDPGLPDCLPILHAAGAAAALLGQPVLAGTYQGRPLTSFRRRNCCLIYRLSPERPAYCGDCVLAQQAAGTPGLPLNARPRVRQGSPDRTFPAWCRRRR